MSKTITKDFKSRQSGFTLVETIVSLALLAIITLGIMAAQAGHVRTADNSRKRTLCTNLAEQGLEKMLAMQFDDLLFLDGSAEEEDYNSIPNYPFFKRITRIERVSDDLAIIQVEVFWQETEEANLPSVLKMFRTRPPEKGVKI